MAFANPTQAKAGGGTLDTVGSAVTTSGIDTNTAADSGWRRTTITLSSAALTWTDNGGSGGYSATKIFDFPEGAVYVSNGFFHVSALSATGVGATSTTIVASLGTAAEATGTTLDSTQADILASTAMGSLTGSAITSAVKATFKDVASDGSATAKDLYLNFAADGTDSTGSGTFTVTGTITFVWCVIQDV